MSAAAYTHGELLNVISLEGFGKHLLFRSTAAVSAFAARVITAVKQ